MLWGSQSKPAELTLEAEGVTPVTWATGLPPRWSYVGLPIFDGTGYPIQRNGVTGIEHVYVPGRPWLSTSGSGGLLAAGKDAEHVEEHLAKWLEQTRHPAILPTLRDNS